MLKRWIPIAMVGLLLLSACSAAEPAPTTTPTSIPATATATLTPAPSQTFTPEPSATLTLTFTPSLTPPPSPTPQAALDQAEVIRIKDGIGGYSLTLEIPNLSQAYDMILGGVRYSCTYDVTYPTWLFCWGLARPLLDQTLTQAFIDQQTNQVLLERKVVLSSRILPTALPEGYANTNCPDRGKNISCETECRVDGDGVPCIVATCTDACGLYRSVHSCPDDMKLPAVVCSEEQWIAAKAKYGIP